MKAIEKVMKALINKGLTPAQVEKDLQFSNGYLATMLRRKGNLGEDRLKKLSLYLNYSLSDLMQDDEGVAENDKEELTYMDKRRQMKLSTTNQGEKKTMEGIPIYDIPIDATFLERYRDEPTFEPIGFLNLPQLRNCNFAARISGNSMYPVMKSGSIAVCRIVDNLDYFDEGEMYFISTTNGFETVKYVQSGDNLDELKLIPHNDKIKPSIIKKSMVIRMCIVEAWVNFR